MFVTAPGGRGSPNEITEAPLKFLTRCTVTLFVNRPGVEAGVGVADGVAVGACVGVGVAVGAWVGVVVAVGVAVGEGVGVGACVGVGVGSGAGVGEGVGVSVGVGVGLAVGPELLPPKFIQPLSSNRNKQAIPRQTRFTMCNSSERLWAGAIYAKFSNFSLM